MRPKKNLDRRNGAGGIGQGERTVRKGGWVQLGGDIFYFPRLEKLVGQRVFVTHLSDAFSPDTAECSTEREEWIRIENIYHLACKNLLPEHLEFLRARLGQLVKL